MFGAVDGLVKAFSNKSSMQLLYEGFGGDDDTRPIADAAFYGLPAFLGFSIQNMVAAPFADPGRDASMLFGFAQLNRAQAIGRAVGAAYDALVTTGGHPADSRAVRDALVQGLAPKAIYRTTQAITGELLSAKTGYPMVKGMSLPEQLLYSMGVNPLRVDQSFRVNQELWKDLEKRKVTTQAYGKAWSEAKAERDYGTMRTIMSRAAAQGVDISAVIRSSKSIDAKGRVDMLERSFNPQEVAKYRSAGLAKRSSD